MVVRLLLLAVLAFAAWKLFRMLTGRGAIAPPPSQDRFEPMARCERCGVYLPAGSLSRSGRCGKCSD